VIYQDGKFPGRRQEGGRLVFYWQCAFPEARDSHDVIHGDVWDSLCDHDRHDRQDRRSLRKEYDSADAAIRDFLRAWRQSGRADDGGPPGSL